MLYLQLINQITRTRDHLIKHKEHDIVTNYIYSVTVIAKLTANNKLFYIIHRIEILVHSNVEHYRDGYLYKFSELVSHQLCLLVFVFCVYSTL